MERVSPQARRAAAARVRRALGAADVDRLLGVTASDGDGTGSQETAIDAVLAARPRPAGQAADDALDLARHLHARWPDGVPAERLRSPLSRAGPVLLAVAVLGAVAAIATRRPALAAVVVVGFVAGNALHLLAARAAIRGRLTRARHALAWAAARPGQVERGLPLASPFRGGATAWKAVAVAATCAAALCAVALASVASSYSSTVLDPELRGPGLLTAALLLLGVASMPRAVVLGRMARVARDHLFSVDDDPGPVAGDALSLDGETFLLAVRASPTGRAQLREHTVHPRTAELPAGDLRRRHAAFVAADADDPSATGERTTWVGPPDQGPVVLHRSQLADPADTLAYLHGWHVADATFSGRSTKVFVAPDGVPARWVERVLPLFGDRHGLDPGSVRAVEPRRLPADITGLSSVLHAPA